MCPWCQRVTRSVSGQLLVEILCSGGLAPMVKAWGGQSSVPVGRVREAAQVCLSRPLSLVGNHCLQKQGCVQPWNPARSPGRGAPDVLHHRARRQPSRSSTRALSRSVRAPRLSVNKRSSKHGWKARQAATRASPARRAELRTPCGAFDPTDPLGGVESGICVG